MLVSSNGIVHYRCAWVDCKIASSGPPSSRQHHYPCCPPPCILDISLGRFSYDHPSWRHQILFDFAQYSPNGTQEPCPHLVDACCWRMIAVIALSMGVDLSFSHNRQRANAHHQELLHHLTLAFTPIMDFVFVIASSSSLNTDHSIRRYLRHLS